MTKRSPAVLAFYVSCAVFLFVAGIVVGRYRVFPYPILEFAKKSLDQVVSDALIAARLRHTEHSAPARYEGRGVTIKDAMRSVDGLTMLAGFFDGSNELRLLRPDGTLVTRWRFPYSKAFPNTGHITPASMTPQSELHVDIHGATALPDGSVVFNYNNAGTVKLDRCSRLQWAVPRMTHHAVSPTDDGGFWIPSQRFVERNSPYPIINTPFLEPTILKIAANGAVEREVSVVGIILNNGMLPQLLANGLNHNLLANRLEAFEIPDDIVHLNDVEELSASMSAAFPQFRRGSLMLSMRDYNMVMVVDPTATKVEWYQIGPWINQHDPDFLPNGRISVFNNNDDGSETGTILGGSSIMEVDPTTRQTTVRYGAPSHRWFTNIMGKHQHIGENVLIAESRAGRVIEVDKAGNVVWEFINRVDDKTVNTVTEAIRYRPGYFTVSDWSCN